MCTCARLSICKHARANAHRDTHLHAHARICSLACRHGNAHRHTHACTYTRAHTRADTLARKLAHRHRPHDRVRRWLQHRLVPASSHTAPSHTVLRCAPVCVHACECACVRVCMLAHVAYWDAHAHIHGDAQWSSCGSAGQANQSQLQPLLVPVPYMQCRGMCAKCQCPTICHKH